MEIDCRASRRRAAAMSASRIAPAGAFGAVVLAHSSHDEPRCSWRLVRRQHRLPVGAKRDPTQYRVTRTSQPIKREPGRGLYVAGVTLPLALADLGLIDEYEFVVQPIVAGHGPTLFAGLSERLELKLVGRQEFRAGAVALRYQPSRVTA